MILKKKKKSPWEVSFLILWLHALSYPTHISFVEVGVAENNDEKPQIYIFSCSEHIQYA